ncbi:MAG: LptF/LptG family permease [Bacteroidetes bacterium]|nr:LptF/LptG family permease [Bacteroidota bacterium]
MKKLDLYIIRKFLGTFFFSIILILMIVIVFDISERMEDFLDKKPPLREIIFDYYLNFIPFFANLFSPLFVFIAVIYFTSRMAYRSEIVAILGSGVSFRRLLRPYMMAATVIAALSLYLNHFVIPQANKTRLAFEEAYLRNPYTNNDRNIHRQIAPGTFIYFNSYNNQRNTGYQFSLEKIHGGTRFYFLKSDYIKWDSTGNKWSLENYFVRQISGMDEVITRGAKLDTVFDFLPTDFGKRENRIEAMQTPELSAFIDEEQKKGSSLIPFYEVEKHRRSSYPFATFVLTLIGASVASRKVRGGIGWHIGLGLMLAFTYILFMQVSTTFATNGGYPALIAVWIPNVIYVFLAFYMLSKAPK